MRTTDAARLAAWAEGELHGENREVGPDVVIDARKATPGSIFVAIPGERVDGHDFTAQAAAQGAAAVICTRQTEAELAHIVVEDSVQGLSRLARGVVEQERDRGLVTLAITGSSGKTSTKDLLAQLLESAGPTVSPVGSFNNEIGVPLTACGVDAQTRFLVSEMGARGLGHVAWLCTITAPTISLVLNIGTAHLGEFGSREAIAQAKGEIVECLPQTGWAVLNADDDLVAAMATRTRARLAWWTRTDWGTQQGGRPAGQLHVSARDITPNSLEQYGFTLVVERDGAIEEQPVQLQLLGSHQVSNALAAATAAIAAGCEPDQVAAALQAATVRSPWRMQMDVRRDGAAILNDSYNANPASMFEAINTIGRIGAVRREQDPSARVYAVLGDMLELGEDADRLHHQIGAQAVRQGVDEVIAVGDFAEQIVAGARSAGGSARASQRDQVAGSLPLEPADVVLVKASRGLALDKVADALLAAGADERGMSGDQR
ncbi:MULTISPECIES: UDP-N-acetylmuramoyl-tripeptide--D-alanyl-D-alanine ligase [unclassified Luteococcus]|uniref:UDP-N-acetylmuramoyl-tripeptide--D-alanyl-D- alanine ligase n=1 Tax=unclassified Luteococcus TaxID=2639923 RepID=UPI00313B73DF